MNTHERDLRPLAPRRIGERVLRLDTVTSTSDVALELAADPAEIGTVVLAEEQTAGRGRLGRGWRCPRGAGVLLSLTIQPPQPLDRPEVLTAWAAVAVAETIRQATGVPARIKWPNDVLLRGRKVAGILIERKSLIVAGIGLNVNQPAEWFAAADLPAAGSLASVTDREFERDAVARQLIRQLDADYSALLDGELAALESRWVWHLGLLGRGVDLELLDGERVRGRLRELTFDRLVLELPSGAAAVWQPVQVRHMQRAE
jgi:BirA family biotin operon repressor/biotin-[acetyl-CoA-carboxylase] ligase